MVQSSRPTERVVRVLELLATHPGRGLRCRDLARAGGLSEATCHAILGTLVATGYVVRDEDARTHTLGPAALALGAAAGESFADVRGARPSLVALASRTGRAVSAAKIVGGEITVVDVVAPAGESAPIRIGARVPFAPPFGAIHVAWSGDAAVAAWMSRAPRATLTASRLRAVLADHRATHVAVAPYTATSVELRAALSELATDALASDVRERTLDLLSAIEELDYTAEAIARSPRLAVNTLTAPVFDADAHTTYAVAIHIGAPDVPTERVRELGDELLAVTDRLTASIGGTRPSARTPTRTPDPEPVLAGGPR